MEDAHLLYEVADGIATITMNRPEKHNAMSPEMMVRLARTWVEVRDDPEVSVALLKGAGDRSFCSGADLGRLIPLFSKARGIEDEWDDELMSDFTGVFNRALLRDFDLYKPVVAAIHGAALAGGTEILMGTDFRIASERAVFGLTEVRRGIIPSGGSLTRLARQIPYTAAMKIVLGGEPVSAEFAERWGLVSQIVAHDEVQDVALATAREVAKAAPLALALAKKAVVSTSGRELSEAFAMEEALGAEAMTTEDAREGPLAFMEKREPRWSGR